MKIFTYFVVVILSYNLMMSPVKASEEMANNFYQVNYDDQQLANKILISFHHAVLEVNHKQKYLIAQLTEKEKIQLKTLAISITPAEKWRAKFQRIINTSQSQQDLTNKFLKKGIQAIEGFECYATVEETYQQAQALATDNPLLATWFDIGDSWIKVNQGEGYDLMVLKITNSEVDKEKPILFIHSAMHAREYAPAALNLDFAKWLLNNYQTDPEAKWIVDNREVHLLFHMNPDGRKVAETQILQRKNMNQQHCASSTVGVDLNRNFAFTWGSTVNGSSGEECAETYRGISAESEPETQAVSNYIRSLFLDERGELPSDSAPIDKSGLHLDIHSYGRLVLWPNGHTDEPSGNDESFVHLGHKLAWFNDYQPQQSIGLYPTDGTSDNVSYGELGVAALTFELGSSFFQDCGEYNRQIKPDNLLALAYAAKVSEAPYQLPLGIDISSMTVNQSLNETTVTSGSIVDLAIAASGKRSKLTDENKTLSHFEYVIDGSFDDTDNFVVLDQSIIKDESGFSLQTQINTDSLGLGSHLLTIRAKDNNGQYGVPSSVFIHIEDNNAPIPSFTATCQDLTCSFDASASTDDDGEIVKFTWSAYQGNEEAEKIGEGQSYEHTFTSAGELNIQLVIEDNSALQAVITQKVTLTKAVVNVVTPEKNSGGSGGGSVYWLLVLVFISKFNRFKLN